MPAYKLAVGDRIEFPIHFTLNDDGKEKRFGMRMTALRQQTKDYDRDVATVDLKTVEYLKQQEVKLVAWIGPAPLLDEQNEPIPAGPEALDALFEMVSGSVGLVLNAFLAANSAKGRSGN